MVQNSMLSKLLPVFIGIMLMLPLKSFAQGTVSGKLTPTAGTIATYSLIDDVIYANANWSADNATVISSTISGLTYSADIKFLGPSGSSTVYFKNGSTIISTLEVTVSCPALAVPNATFSYLNNCGNTVITYSGTPRSTANWFWQTNSTGISTDESATTYTVTSSAIYYLTARSISAPNCWSTGQATSFVTVLQPIIANAGPDQIGSSTCGNTSVTLAGNSPISGTGNWSIISGTGGSFGDASSAISTFNGIEGSSYVLRWTIINGLCSTSTDDVVITLNGNPTVANAGADQTGSATCGLTSVTLAANTPSIGTGSWNVVSGIGGTFGNASSATSSFSGVAGLTYVLRWFISNKPCVISSDDVTITFNQNPTIAYAGLDQTGSATCGLTSVTLGGNNPSVGTGGWTVVSGAGGTFGNAASSTSSFSGNSGSTYVLRWTISNSPCASSTDDVTITFNRTPTASSAGPDQSSCGLTSVTLAGNTPSIETGIWNVVSGAGGTFVNALSATSGFSGTAGASYVLRWTISNSPCLASIDDVTITFNQTPTTSNAGLDQTGASTCGLTSVTLAGNTPTIGTGNWSIISGTGGAIGNTSSATSSFSGTAGSTYTLRWTISNGSCTPSIDDVIITFNRAPTVSNAGPDQTSSITCGLTSITLAANTPTVGMGNWSIINGSGGSFANTSSATSSFSGTAGSTYVLRWSITSSPCAASTDDVTITFNRNPTSANAGLDQTGSTTCGLTSVALAGNIPIIGTGSWIVVSGTGGTFGNASSATSSFSGSVGSTYTLRWTISNAPCVASTDDVTIIFNWAPTISNAGPDRNVCGVTTVTLGGNLPTVGSGIWTKVSGTGGSFSNIYNPTSTFTGTLGNAYQLRWSITNIPCLSSTDDVNIAFGLSPTIANAGPDQTGSSTCGLLAVTLAGNIPTTGTGSWSILSGAGGSFGNVASATSTFSGTAGTAYSLMWTISSGSCTPSSDNLNITFNRAPASNPTVTGNNLFGPGMLTMTAAGAAVGENYAWYNSTNNLLQSGAIFTTPVINSSITSYCYVVITNSSCQSTKVWVDVLIAPIPVITSNGNRVVLGSSITLDAGAGYASYLWTNSNNAQVGDVQNLSTTTPGIYKVTVTKTGFTGNATSNPFNVTGQLDGLNMNYVISNTIQDNNVTDPTIVNSLSADKISQVIQYFDGLGRPVQTVSTQGSPNKFDLVQPVYYDEYGRESRKYLPVVPTLTDGWFKPGIIDSSGNFSGVVSNFYSNTFDKIADDIVPYSETIFESSPINRVIEQAAPGAAWKPDGINSYTSTDRTVKMSYETNGSAEVLLWTFTYPTEEYTTTALNAFGKIEAGTAAAPTYYNANQLYKNKTKDEERNEVIEYVNKEGRTILKRVQVTAGTPAINDANYASTYYIYDDFGNLVVVIPPEAVKRITQTSPVSEYYGKTDIQKNDFLKNWAFRYRYDARMRMTMKQVPGAEPVYMVYDNRDRLILTQDGNQRAGATNAIKYWTFTKYDELNRPIITGIKDTTTTVQLTQLSMQTVVNNHFAKASSRWGETYVGAATGNVHGYTNKAYPVRTGSTSAEIDVNKYLTVTFYDDYSFRSLWSGTYTYLNEGLSETYNGIVYSQPAVENIRLVGLVTGSKIKVLDGGVTGGYTWLKSISYYDDKYRVAQVLSDNYKGGIDMITNIVDFTGKVLKSKLTHTEADVTWKDLVSVQQVGNQLKSTSTTSGAASLQQLAAGQNGWMEAIYSEGNTTRYIGLNDANPDAASANINYAFQFTSANTVKVYENGTVKATITGINAGDVFRIGRTGTAVTYTRNGNAITLSPASTASSTLLMVDASFGTSGASLTNVRSSFSTSTQTTIRRFEYDHVGRLLKTWHNLNSAGEILLSLNEYNELGQLVDKKLHSTVTTGANAKQSVDYRYNIRGWLTSMNDASLTNTGINNDDTNDLFGMNLVYNETTLGVGNVGLFNGNISGMTWSNNLALGTTKQNGYIYTYDPMNRIKTSTFKEKAAGWTAPTNSALAETGFTYDLNGNIVTLQRNDRRATGLMDNLQYSYGTGSNKLLRVTDSGDDYAGFIDGNPAATDDYSYDVNGNMTRDINKGIGTSLTDVTNLITYNYLNLPETVTKGNNSARYIYDAGGRKLSQVTTFGGQQKQVDYAGEFQYENDVLQFISHEEGRIVLTGNKSMYVHSGDVLTGITAATSTLALITQNGSTYVRANASSTATKQGMFPIGGTLAVQPGERYLIRAKGYRAGANSVHLYIRTNSTDLNWPGAQLPYLAIAEASAEQVITIPAGHTTLQAGVVWNTVTKNQQFFLNDFEITKLTTTTPEYQYHLKDHLGNVRLTFTSKDEAEANTATMETANANTEQSQFINYTEAIKVNTTIFDHTNAGSTYYSTRLTGGTTNAIQGLAKSLSVMPGDKIDIEVFAKYLDPNSANWTAAMTSFMAAIAGGTAPAGTVVDGGLAGSLGNGTFPFPSVLVRNNDNGTGPKGYLNYLVFDRNYVYKDGGFRRLSTTARETGTDTPHERLAFDGASQILIKEPGYVYIWLSNENETAVEVYFDDFKVTHTKSPVIQEDDYYAFGLTFNSYSRENSIHSSYLYNEKELQDELDLGWLDYGARMYNSALGRWFNIDPLTDKFPGITFYAYCANNPINLIDPDGRAWKPTTDQNSGKQTGYEWISEDQSYDEDGALKIGLYGQAIFFSHNRTFDLESDYNIGSSTAYVYKSDGTTQTFNANTYPSDQDDYATVPEGRYEAKVGMHKESYKALRMADLEATDFSDNRIELGKKNPAYDDDRTYASGINIHKAGVNNKTGMTTTGSPISAGCSLIDRENWNSFIGIFNTDAQKNNKVSVTISRTYSVPTNQNVPFLIRQFIITSDATRVVLPRTELRN